MATAILVHRRRQAITLDALGIECEAHETPIALNGKEPTSWWIVTASAFAGSAQDEDTGEITEGGVGPCSSAMAMTDDHLIGIVSPDDYSGAALWFAWPTTEIKLETEGTKGVFKKRPATLTLTMGDSELYLAGINRLWRNINRAEPRQEAAFIEELGLTRQSPGEPSQGGGPRPDGPAPEEALPRREELSSPPPAQLPLWRRHRLAMGAIAAALVLAAISLVVIGLDTGGDDSSGGGVEELPDSAVAQLPGGCAEVETPDPESVQARPPAEELSGAATAAVETSCGSFTIELDVSTAPRTTSSFASLAEQGFYDGTAIHRIEPGFVVQGGDPQGDGTGGPGYSVDEPPPQDLSYTRGTVAMAKTDAEPPGRSGSQFFVVTAPTDAGLPPDYALLGRVSEGFEVIERIEQLGSAGGRPSAPVVIEHVSIDAGA